jgi:hypothetical protein
MKAKLAFAAGVLVGALVTASLLHRWETPREYFRRTANTDAFGLFKNSSQDHVATFHGFIDDRVQCERTAETLNTAEGGGHAFFCSALQN